ncbi:hypothetical protein [Methylobacterium bullatum]|uniref:Uncharacterized protein n=1 Tax=Methylobacterium bullatum TaxID=570505 RepID=A0AAV4Z8N2_9HYPH|nr:hypothetical protein [Methylobacterium bullatum]MBD8902563.1 hypothetical protein [Methylobacterium bullatum]GJD40340.1 hypothetical protein OICFNHDK_2809 [Methylobacterium bullatum]
MRAALVRDGVGVVVTHTLHRMHGVTFISARAKIALLSVAMAGAFLPTQTAKAVESITPAKIPPTCEAGSECRLPEATFACSLDVALAIAQAGPDRGRQTGLAAVQAGTCEIVPANRWFAVEATKSAQVMYATDKGRHLGYIPMGVFAPAGSATATTCQGPGFCAVRPGPPVWACPSAADLTLDSTEAKSAAKCVQVGEGNTGEVGSAVASTGPIVVSFGSGGPFQSSYYLARGDLVGIGVTLRPTPAGRSWCKPGDWCVTSAPTLFCADRAAYERVLTTPVGEPRRTAITNEPGCRVVIRGNPMKPGGVPAAGDPAKLVAVEHPVFKTGWASAAAFKVVSYKIPLRFTARLSDIMIEPDHSPALAATALTGQGSSAATGVFRAGPKERLSYCKKVKGDENRDDISVCVARMPDETQTAKANCYRKTVTLDDKSYRLAEKPSGSSADIHIDADRQWLFQDIASGEWLDGSTRSNEATVATAYNALCPGTMPEASWSVIYRDPGAEYPRELIGRWFNDRRACRDPKRNQPDYDEYGVLTILTAGTNRNARLRVSAESQCRSARRLSLLGCRWLTRNRRCRAARDFREHHLHSHAWWAVAEQGWLDNELGSVPVRARMSWSPPHKGLLMEGSWLVLSALDPKQAPRRFVSDQSDVPPERPIMAGTTNILQRTVTWKGREAYRPG